MNERCDATVKNGVYSFRCDLEAGHSGRHHHVWTYNHMGHTAATTWPNDNDPQDPDETTRPSGVKE